jgi:hypothetical protein
MAGAWLVQLLAVAVLGAGLVNGPEWQSPPGIQLTTGIHAPGDIQSAAAIQSTGGLGSTSETQSMGDSHPMATTHSTAGIPSSTDEIQVDREARTVSFTATLQSEAFRNSLPPDHQYHAVVNREGGAADKALFVTDADDGAIAAALRELGAQDGGGVPMSAWNYRWVPLVTAPASRVNGSRIHVSVQWGGSGGNRDLDELLADPGGEGIQMRFGGNEEHDHLWESGCILCLFSCPGGVISNASYTIRDHQRSATTFEPDDQLPPDGSQVTITLALAPG